MLKNRFHGRDQWDDKHKVSDKWSHYGFIGRRATHTVLPLIAALEVFVHWCRVLVWQKCGSTLVQVQGCRVALCISNLGWSRLWGHFGTGADYKLHGGDQKRRRPWCNCPTPHWTRSLHWCIDRHWTPDWNCLKWCTVSGSCCPGPPIWSPDQRWR